MREEIQLLIGALGFFLMVGFITHRVNLHYEILAKQGLQECKTISGYAWQKECQLKLNPCE